MAYYGPPPFQPQPVRRKSNAPLWITIILAVVLVPCGLLIAGIFWFKGAVWDKAIAPLAGCEISFRDVRQSVIDYADANGGKLPDAVSWEDSVRPFYAKRYQHRVGTQPFALMSPDSSWGCAPIGEKGSPTGMAFNSDLSGKKLSDIKDPYSTVLIFEIPRPARNAHQPYKEPEDAGPTFFGSKRPWLFEYVKGSARHNGDFNMNVDDNPSSKSDGDSDSDSSPSKGDVKIHVDKDKSGNGGSVDIHVNSNSSTSSGSGK